MTSSSPTKKQNCGTENKNDDDLCESRVLSIVSHEDGMIDLKVVTFTSQRQRDFWLMLTGLDFTSEPNPEAGGYKFNLLCLLNPEVVDFVRQYLQLAEEEEEKKKEIEEKLSDYFSFGIDTLHFILKHVIRFELDTFLNAPESPKMVKICSFANHISEFDGPEKGFYAVRNFFSWY